MTVDCPLDCEYLIEAHKHEKPPELDPKTLPNRELEITEQFVDEHNEFFLFLAHALSEAALQNRGVVDFDVREALDASVRTHQTLQTGLVYESVPANPLAAAVFRALEKSIGEYRTAEAERLGVHKTRESTLVNLLVFLQRLEFTYNNGRRRGRAFLDLLLHLYPSASGVERPSDSSLILP